MGKCINHFVQFLTLYNSPFLTMLAIFLFFHLLTSTKSSSQEIWEYFDKRLREPPTSQGTFINSGTPDGITLSFDCTVREYAYSYGKEMHEGRHGTFVELFDALQLQACNMTRPTPTKRTIPTFPKHDPNDISADPCIFYVDPNFGSDSNNGTTPDNAYLTIEKAVDSTRNTRNGEQLCTINLLEGTFYQKNLILLTSDDSFLTIQNYDGQEVILSGGVELEFDDEWKLEEYSEVQWIRYNNSNNVYGRADASASNDLIKYIGTFNTYEKCQEAVINSAENPFYSFTWHSSGYGDFSYECFGVRDLSWQPVTEDGIYSGRLEGRNIWSRKVKNINELNNNFITGLRLNNERSIRARYPDQITEISMQYSALSGWIQYDTRWKPPNKVENAKDIIQSAQDWPGVIWPMDGPGNTTWTGEGDWGYFWIGKGGPCYNMEPDYGYWCSADAPRQITQHEAPSGVYLNPDAGFSLPYDSGATDAVVHAWRPYHWYTNMWNISSYDPDSTLLEFDFGGTQGGEGETTGAEWYIENVFEELTMPNEYFYNRSTNRLYYYYNSTFSEPPPANSYFVATRNKIMFNISGHYRKQNGPIVKNVTIRGLTFRDTAYSYLDPHGLPSGGDWAIAKQGAIYIQGSEHCTFDNLHMTRLDSNGIFIYAYNRNLTVSNSHFEWLGENAIASWGYTEGLEDVLPGGGPDGRPGNQPRFTNIYNNLAREIGIFEKQASMWFQAQTAQTYFHDNIFFNGPRAGINFNDGFGQNNHLYNNLLINTCRESGDHGNWNSWDRVPYITRIGNGSDSIIPGWNYIYNNFMIGTYQVLLDIDTDDGSSYYKAFNNFFVYGGSAMKNDFGGHDTRFYDNLFAYISNPIFAYFCCTAGAYDMFIGNTLVLNDDSFYTSNCNLPDGTVGMIVSNNTVYIPNPNAFRVCGMSMDAWQSQGNDPGTTINPLITDEQVIELAKQLLGH